jgi:hypothetical protein
MPKPLQIPVEVAPSTHAPKRIPSGKSAALIIPLHLPKKDQAERHLMVEHKPGKPSIILLKIKAMETYFGNAAQVDRRRRFCKNYVAPLKSASGD